MSALSAQQVQAGQQPEGLNLKQRQTAVMSRLLSLQSRDDSGDPLSSLSSLSLSSSSSSSSAGSAPEWKVLIYDRGCQDILSPLLTVAELRRLGITLHMSLTAPRERVPDVPAIYLVRPTAENVALIARDLRKGLYDSTYLNFSTSIPRAMLEQFAHSILAPTGPDAAGAGKSAAGASTNPAVNGAAAASRVVRILDQYVDFISLEDRLFTLNAADSFPRLHGTDEMAMLAHVDAMVESLFCVVVTMGQVPIIRAKVGHAAEMVAQKLEARIREHLASRQNLFSASMVGALNFHRPLLLIMDRTFDLSAPLLHSWTYQALLHDLLGMQSNRVTVTVQDAPVASATTATGGAPAAKVAPKPKTYDLLSAEDKFWKHNAGKAFPRVAEAVQERLDAYQKEFNEVTRRAGSSSNPASGVGGGGATSDADGMDSISAAISSLPKLQRRKKLLDTHMNIATALLREIKKREVDVFFDVEQTMAQRGQVDKQVLASIFGGSAAPPDAQGGKGTFLDKLRCFLVYFLTNNNLGEEAVKQYRALLTSVAQAQADTAGTSTGAAGPNGPASAPLPPSSAQALLPELAALDYVQHHKFLHRLTSGGDDFGGSSAPTPSKSASSASSASSGPGGMLGNFSKLADSLYGGGVGLLAGVRNLLPTNNHLPLTRVVEALVTNKGSGGDEEAKYCYLDPKAPRGSRVSRPSSSGSFKECLVFVLGGGNYSEYQNLQDWQKEHQANLGVQSVVYGCSELVSPEQFVRQLAALHHASQQAQRANVPVD